MNLIKLSIERPIAIVAMVQESAQLPLERAVRSKTRTAGEQLNLELRDICRFLAQTSHSRRERMARAGEDR